MPRFPAHANAVPGLRSLLGKHLVDKVVRVDLTAVAVEADQGKELAAAMAIAVVAIAVVTKTTALGNARKELGQELC